MPVINNKIVLNDAEDAKDSFMTSKPILNLPKIDSWKT